MDRLKKAEKSMRRAKKRKGKAATELYEKAVARFERAIVKGLDAHSLKKVHIRKGNCFCRWAQALVTDINSIPYEKSSRCMHQNALNRAKELLQAAVTSYKQTRKGRMEWDLDVTACANCGHALSIWAELCEADEKIALLQSSIQCYRNVLEAHVADAEIQMDLADALIHLAEALSESNRREDSLRMFQEAMKIFEEAHAIIDERRNNRRAMAELKLRCGIGHITAAEHALERDNKILHCAEAVQLLEKAAELEPSSGEVLNALGDALEASAEACQARDARGFLLRALNDGYRVARHKNRTDVNAILGIAKVSFLMAKLEVQSGNDPSALFLRTIRQYEKALHSSQLTGFHERSEAVYNYGCCCALAGREDIAQRCFEGLLLNGGTTTLEMSTDKDLRTIREAEWFQSLITRHEDEFMPHRE